MFPEQRVFHASDPDAPTTPALRRRLAAEGRCIPSGKQNIAVVGQRCRLVRMQPRTATPRLTADHPCVRILQVQARGSPAASLGINRDHGWWVFGRGEVPDPENPRLRAPAAAPRYPE